MSDYISREAVLNASKIVYIEYIEIDGDGYEDGNADEIPVVFKRDIEAIPAADVRPVVLCKDCVHFQQFSPHDGFCKIDGMLWNNDFFCANGWNRRSDDV